MSSGLELKKIVIPEIKPKSDAQKVSTLGGFLAGGIAACGAVTFTNPIELIKTRMQLQGELMKKGSDTVRLYKNPFQAFVVIYKNEGIRGLQQGLACGYYYQLALNGCRIGLYEPSRVFFTKYLTPNNYHEDSGIKHQNIGINVAAGFISGSAGAALASPFFLVKTRMQSFTKAPIDAVGQQTYYRNAWDGIRTIYNLEGIKGLYRGVDAAILRTGAGSSAQLPVYFYTKNWLINNNIVKDHSFSLHFLSSCAAGLGVAIVMNPWDVILTRVYNQSGNLYSGPIDCFTKTIKSEGVTALYKGFWAQLFRIGPHSILTLMFMEQCMKAMMKLENIIS
jgi:solute carrier family 25 protein 34/35